MWERRDFKLEKCPIAWGAGEAGDLGKQGRKNIMIIFALKIE
jgi:hypothetical protein